MRIILRWKNPVKCLKFKSLEITYIGKEWEGDRGRDREGEGDRGRERETEREAYRERERETDREREREREGVGGRVWERWREFYPFCGFKKLKIIQNCVVCHITYMHTRRMTVRMLIHYSLSLFPVGAIFWSSVWRCDRGSSGVTRPGQGHSHQRQQNQTLPHAALSALVSFHAQLQTNSNTSSYGFQSGKLFRHLFDIWM